MRLVSFIFLRLVGVVVGVALVATSVLSILHVVIRDTFDLELGNLHCQLCVVCLLIVGVHLELGCDRLVLVDANRLRNKESCLVPVSGWVLRPRVEDDLTICAREVRVEPKCIAVQNSCLSHLVIEAQMNSLQLLDGASFKVKLFAEAISAQTLFRVISV